jgi:hypothetical protein
MQNQAVLKCQEVGIDGYRECIANVRVLCDAPRLVIRQTFAVETSFAGDEFFLVARDDLLMDGHKHSPRSTPIDYMGKSRGAMRTVIALVTTATHTDSAPNQRDGVFLTAPYRSHMIAST